MRGSSWAIPNEIESAPREATRFDRLGNLLGFALVPLAAMMQLVDLRSPILGLPWLSAELLGYGVVTAASLPWLWARRGEISRWGGVVLGSFGALLVYALVTVALHPLPVVTTSQAFTIRPLLVVVPLLSSALSLTAGLGLVIAAQARLRPLILMSASTAMLAVGFLAWPRQAAIHRSWRFATGMAGSATLHVVMLVVAAFGVGCVLIRYRPRWGLVLAAAASVGLLLTGSRGGLLGLVAAVVIFGVATARTDNRRMRRLLLTAAVAMGVAVATIAPLRRMLSFSDPKRAQNLESALGIWLRDPQTTVFGAGAGQVWPWYAFDTGAVPIPGDGLQHAPGGDVLLSPHSTALFVMTELGGVGIAISLVFVGALFALMRTAKGDLLRLAVAAALLGSLVAFLFDTYLVKNFGVALWWWAFAALGLLRPPGPQPSDESPAANQP